MKTETNNPQETELQETVPEPWQADVDEFKNAVQNFLHPSSLELMGTAQNQLTAFRKLFFQQKIKEEEVKEEHWDNDRRS